MKTVTIYKNYYSNDRYDYSMHPMSGAMRFDLEEWGIPEGCPQDPMDWDMVGAGWTDKGLMPVVVDEYQFTHVLVIPKHK